MDDLDHRERSSEFLIEEAFRLHRALSLLSPEGKNLIRNRAMFHSYQKGEVLLREGCSPECVHLILRGFVGISRQEPDAPEVLVTIIGPGQSLGDVSLLLNTEYVATGTALTDLRTLCLNRRDFLYLMSSEPRLPGLAALEAARKTSELLSRLSNSYAETAEARLAAFFAHLDGLEGARTENGWLHLPFTLSRSQIAAAGRCRPETVSRVLSAWKKNKIFLSAPDGDEIGLRRSELLDLIKESQES